MTGSNFDLSARAMLVGLTVHAWAARKHDKRVTKDVAERENATSSAGRYNKALLPKAALKNIQAAAQEARLAHYKRTLPWLDEGARILSAQGYMEYTREVREVARRFDLEVDKFCRNYNDFVEDAKRELGTLYNSADYPHETQIRKRFSIVTRIVPFPQQQDFRASLPDEELQKIKDDIEQNVRTSLELGTRDIFERVQTLLTHASQKLKEYEPGQDGEKAKGIFRDSLITNITELVDLMPSLNVTGDNNVEEIQQELQKLTEHSAQALRIDDTLRKNVAEQADTILAKVSEFMV